MSATDLTIVAGPEDVTDTVTVGDHDEDRTTRTANLRRLPRVPATQKDPSARVLSYTTNGPRFPAATQCGAVRSLASAPSRPKEAPLVVVTEIAAIRTRDESGFAATRPMEVSGVGKKS